MLRNKRLSYALPTLITILTVATTLVSCNRNTVFYHYEHTPITGWEKNDTLIFDVPSTSASGRYEEEVGLRINGSYPFMSLTLIIDQTVLPDNITRSDTLNCRLTTPGGNKKGHGVSCYQYSFPLKDINLKQGDSLHICIRHNMKREILPGISDIGMKISCR